MKSIDKDVRASEIMTRSVITLAAHDSLREAARTFVENNISAAAVVDLKGKAIGVISKTDLARFNHETIEGVAEENSGRALRTGETMKLRGFHSLPEEDTVEQWMTPAVFTVGPDASIEEVAKKMVKNGIHHLFVKNDSSDTLLGVISTFALVEYLAGHRK